jgi:hypothetical protein
MHHRNERDAIIQHGTMTLIRARALREHVAAGPNGRICEDAELGLRADAGEGLSRPCTSTKPSAAA